MTQSTMDFDLLNRQLLGEVPALLEQWLPGGKVRGHEYICGSLSGGEGRSCSVNLVTGQWADFASGEKGRDLISLFANIQRISNGEAYKQLTGDRDFKPRPASERPARKDPKHELQIGVPPDGAPAPDIRGEPSAVHVYRSPGGTPVYYVVKYLIDGEKVYSPRGWSETKDEWVKKSWPADGSRPLYGLDRLKAQPEAPVLLVEGEKCVDALLRAREEPLPYVVVTWSGGGEAWRYSDFKPLKGRSVLIWPDADGPGLKTAEGIAGELWKRCPDIRIIDTTGMADKWDVADALGSGWDWPEIVRWAKPRARKAKDPSADEAPTITDPDTENQRACFDIWTELGIVQGRGGAPLKDLHNSTTALRNWKPLQGRIWYDEFHDKVFTTFDCDRTREWADEDTLRIARYFQQTLKLPFNDDLMKKAVRLHAGDNKKNEPLDWLNSLAWDGELRIDEAFVEALGAEESVYTYAVSRNFFIAMCARIARPGCKMDNMVILEGKQGARKSSALGAIAAPWFAEATENVNSKDFFLSLQGKVLLEVGEMDAFNKAETTRIKQIISSPSDRYRPPYGHAARDFPRRCVFVGSTNDDNYLRDHTGARRFWPIRCGEIRLDVIHENRTQYFAEAYAALKDGAKWWDMPEVDTEREQEERRQADSWEELIANWLPSVGGGEITAARIMRDCLDIEPGRQDTRASMRVGRSMKTLGYRSRVTSADGKSVRLYVKESRA